MITKAKNLFRQVLLWILRKLSKFIHIKWRSKKSPTGKRHYCRGCGGIENYPCDGLR